MHSSPCLRVSVVKRKPSPVTRLGGARRGQTMIIALAVLFLLSLVTGIFVAVVLRNLNRTARRGRTAAALTLALGGLQYAAQQFRSSEEGLEWRPGSQEPDWQTASAARAV